MTAACYELLYRLRRGGHTCLAWVDFGRNADSHQLNLSGRIRIQLIRPAACYELNFIGSLTSTPFRLLNAPCALAVGSWQLGVVSVVLCYWNVLHESTLPDSSPRRNHWTRCSEDPCVKDSGTTRPCDWRCSRSSPMAAAALRPSSASPGSTRPSCAA